MIYLSVKRKIVRSTPCRFKMLKTEKKSSIHGFVFWEFDARKWNCRIKYTDMTVNVLASVK